MKVNLELYSRSPEQWARQFVLENGRRKLRAALEVLSDPSASQADKEKAAAGRAFLDGLK